jgi:hypothetical protein
MVALLAQRPAASLEITGQKPSVSAKFDGQFAAYQCARALRARAAGFRARAGNPDVAGGQAG